jgi:hypothetical protein
MTCDQNAGVRGTVNPDRLQGPGPGFPEDVPRDPSPMRRTAIPTQVSVSFQFNTKVDGYGAHAPRSPERSVTLLSENLNRATFYAGPHRDSVRILVNPRSIRSPTGRGCGRTPPGKCQATWRGALHRRSGCRAWFTGSRGRILPGRTPTGTRWQDSTAPPFCPARRFPAPVGPKLAGMPSKGDEMDEASDLRVVPVDSTDPEVRTNFRRFARLESRFHSGEQAAASP